MDNLWLTSTLDTRLAMELRKLGFYETSRSSMACYCNNKFIKIKSYSHGIFVYCYEDDGSNSSVQSFSVNSVQPCLDYVKDLKNA